uniref:Uncharacterized protein n=1 Tax=viral metagenome TaxID=1070528 RepID=A0A6M3LES3_9ZZZZ
MDAKVKEHRANGLLILFILVVMTIPAIPPAWYSGWGHKPADGGMTYVRFYAGRQLRHVTLSSVNVWMTSLPDSTLKLADERTGRLIWSGTRAQFLAAIVDTVTY